MKKAFVVLLVLFTALSSLKISDKRIEEKVFTPCIINIESTRERKPGEKNKCMSGVCLDNEYSFSGIKDFENKTQTENDVYIKHISGSDEFPAEFIIECISKGKTPMLILDSSVSNTEDISKKINSIAPYSFIALDCGNNITNYNYNAKIIRKYAPSSVIMWNTDNDCSINDFPNSEYVDWVMINIDDNCWDINALRNNIKYFEDLPVAINVSVQSFSQNDHRYYTDKWVNMVSDAYETASEYENTALVSYVSNSGNNRVYGSSSISESERLRTGYKNVVDLLSQDRKWSSTDEVAYINNGIAYVENSIAEKLNIDKKFVNNKYAVIKNYNVDKSGRKMFVYLEKM